MPVAATDKLWTLGELHALPDDGNKYELVHGVLLVTPAPAPWHETVASRLAARLALYVAAQRLGQVYRPRAVVRYRGSEVEPDLMVRAELSPDADWELAPQPILVVEILSPSTRNRDLGVKRELYREVGIPEYWIVRPDEHVIAVVRPGEPDNIVRDTIVWHPTTATAPLTLDVAQMLS